MKRYIRDIIIAVVTLISTAVLGISINYYSNVQWAILDDEGNKRITELERQLKTAKESQSEALTQTQQQLARAQNEIKLLVPQSEGISVSAVERRQQDRINRVNDAFKFFIESVYKTPPIDLIVKVNGLHYYERCSSLFSHACSYDQRSSRFAQFPQIKASLEELCRSQYQTVISSNYITEIPEGSLKDRLIAFFSGAERQRGRVDCESIEHTRRVDELTGFAKFMAKTFSTSYPYYIDYEIGDTKNIELSFESYVRRAMTLVGDLRLENRRYQDAISSYNLTPK